MNSGDSYTGAMQQVLIQLGRIDGKIDAFDARVREIEKQQAAWKELIRVTEQDSKHWKARIVKNESRLEVVETVQRETFSIRKHWRWILAAALPAALVILNIVDTIGDINRGVFGGG